MKSLTLKSWVLAAGLTFATFTASAAVSYTTPDLDQSAGNEYYKFSSVGYVGKSFSDYLKVTFLGQRDLSATVSGTSTKSISFSKFDLYDGKKKTLLAKGDISNTRPKLAFGGLESSGAKGDYYLFIKGISSGKGGYNGSVALTSPVPEPETYGMMIAGLGLMGFVARRRKIG